MRVPTERYRPRRTLGSKQWILSQSDYRERRVAAVRNWVASSRKNPKTIWEQRVRRRGTGDPHDPGARVGREPESPASQRDWRCARLVLPLHVGSHALDLAQDPQQIPAPELGDLLLGVAAPH